MDALERAQATVQAYVDEILENLHIREDFTSFFVGRSAELYAYKDHKNYPGLSAQLSKAISRKSAAPDSAYRGLFVELTSTFERGVKSISEAVITHKQSRASKYSDLDEKFQNRHAVYSAKVLAKIGDGAINGAKYDFDSLQKNLGTCFTDSSPLQLNVGIFTVFIGNCTPERLERLFEEIGLSPPFSDSLGRNALVKKWSGNKGANEAAKSVRKELEIQLERRNEIVHGITGGKRIEPSDLEKMAELTTALIGGFTENARNAMN